MITDEILDSLSPRDLPHRLRAIADVVGVRAAVRLAEAFPGGTLRMPRSARIEIAKGFINEHLADMTDEQLSAHLGVSAGFVAICRQRHTAPRVEMEEHLGRVEMFTIGTIVSEVATHFHVSVEDLSSTSRERSVAWPRQIAMYLCRRLLPNLTQLSIAEAFGRRDHTTVGHALVQVQDQIVIDHDLAKTVQTLISNILSSTNRPPAVH